MMSQVMHAVTAWALLLWFRLGYTFISSYFDFNEDYLQETLQLQFVREKRKQMKCKDMSMLIQSVSLDAQKAQYK